MSELFKTMLLGSASEALHILSSQKIFQEVVVVLFGFCLFVFSFPDKVLRLFVFLIDWVISLSCSHLCCRQLTPFEFLCLHSDIPHLAQLLPYWVFTHVAQGTKDPLFLTGVTFPPEYPIYEETKIKLTVYDVKDKSQDTVSSLLHSLHRSYWGISFLLCSSLALLSKLGKWVDVKLVLLFSCA